MKKPIFLALSGLFVAVPHAIAAGSGFVPLAPIPGLTDFSPTAVVNSETLAAFLNNLYMYLIGLAAILAVIEIIWGGLEISTKDSIPAQMDGKERIRGAILGLVLVLSPALVFSIINPKILNLSLNLPELKTASAPSGLGGSGPGGPVIDQSTQCSVVGDQAILQIATCPSSAAATTWGQTCTGSAILSSIEVITNNADGTPASARVLCIRNNRFMFIDLHRTFGIYSINDLKPLAVVSNTVWGGPNTLYEANASDAIKYASICTGAGLAVCTDSPATSLFADPCIPLPSTPLPADAPSPAKCYVRTLSCVNMGPIGTAITGMCSRNPSWTPFQ